VRWCGSAAEANLQHVMELAQGVYEERPAKAVNTEVEHISKARARLGSYFEHKSASAAVRGRAAAAARWAELKAKQETGPLTYKACKQLLVYSWLLDKEHRQMLWAWADAALEAAKASELAPGAASSSKAARAEKKGSTQDTTKSKVASLFAA
jgi:hypothetical protein